MTGGALHRTGFSSAAAEEFVAEAAYAGRLGTVARLAAEAAEVDAFLVAVPAVELLGAGFRDHVYGLRAAEAGWPPVVFGDDTEIVCRYLRRSPDHEWLTLECVPRDGGTACRRALSTDDDPTSGRLRAALLTYGFGGHPEGFAALARSLARGPMGWLPEELAAARAEGVCTPDWWGALLYPGGLADDDTATLAADLARFDAALSPAVPA